MKKKNRDIYKEDRIKAPLFERGFCVIVPTNPIFIINFQQNLIKYVEAIIHNQQTEKNSKKKLDKGRVV